MVLVDTSVWVSHFRRKNPRLESLLLNDLVYCHSFVIGELACGNLRNRDEILSLLRELPPTIEATHEDILIYIEKYHLMALPVVNDKRELVGTVTISDIVSEIVKTRKI